MKYASASCFMKQSEQTCSFERSCEACDGAIRCYIYNHPYKLIYFSPLALQMHRPTYAGASTIYGRSETVIENWRHWRMVAPSSTHLHCDYSRLYSSSCIQPSLIPTKNTAILNKNYYFSCTGQLVTPPYVLGTTRRELSHLYSRHTSH
jgi:hypothetical protein